MRWFSVRKANIPAGLKNIFDQAGVTQVQWLVFSAMVNRTTLPLELSRISDPSSEREAAQKWLLQKADEEIGRAADAQLRK